MAGFWINGPDTGSGFGASGVGGVGVIDGNGDGIWWQVLALAFCGHWAVGGPANNFTMTQFSKLDEYIFQFGQIHFPILMNIFCYSDNIFSSGFLRAMGSSGSLTMAGLCDTRPLGRDKASGGRGRGSGTKQQKCGQPTNHMMMMLQYNTRSAAGKPKPGWPDLWLPRGKVLSKIGIFYNWESQLVSFIRSQLQQPLNRVWPRFFCAAHSAAKKPICVCHNTYSDKIGYFDPDGKETKTEKTK